MKYKTKPTVIEAFKIGRDAEPDWLFTSGQKVTKEIIPYCDTPEEFCKAQYYIETLEGTMKADFGDFIIKGLIGEIYPCKPEAFEKKYELSEEQP